MLFVGVVTYWMMGYRLYRLCFSQTWSWVTFSEHCWPWSYCTGIIYRLGIINQVRNVGTSVIRTFHLSGMAAISLWIKGSGWLRLHCMCTPTCLIIITCRYYYSYCFKCTQTMCDPDRTNCYCTIKFVYMQKVPWLMLHVNSSVLTCTLLMYLIIVIRSCSYGMQCSRYATMSNKRRE